MPFEPREVKAQMARNGLTVDQLSAVSGVPAPTIYKALGPKGNPTVETLEKLARGLGLADEGVFFVARQHCSVNRTA